MATYSITSEVPFAAIDLNVTFGIDVQCSYAQQVQSDKSGQELTDHFQGYANGYENDIKTLPFFTVQDETRNATFALVEDPIQSVAEGYTGYICTVSFTIEEAVVLQQTTRATELTGTAKDEYLSAEADAVEAAFKAERQNWTDL